MDDLAYVPIARRFKLFMRCECCRRESVRVLEVPDVEEAPTDVEELLCSSILDRQPFTCASCEGTIAILVGVSPVQIADAA